MDQQTAAVLTAPAVTTVGSYFMLDGETYKRGAELGFEGLDFYITGRGGVLGDVDADVVSAAFAFFEPGTLRALWEKGRAVMPVTQAASEFAACAETWAEAHVPEDFDSARLAELANQVASGARLACAPVFAGWRQLATPASPAAAAVHHLNGLRELRQGIHAGCVLAYGLTPLEAQSLNQPGMAPLFGWSELAETDGLQPQWDAAEEATTVAMAHAYAGLTDAERSEFSELADQLHKHLANPG